MKVQSPAAPASGMEKPETCGFLCARSVPMGRSGRGSASAVTRPGWSVGDGALLDEGEGSDATAGMGESPSGDKEVSMRG